MILNVANHIAAIERSVSHMMRDDRPAYSVILARTYATGVDDLWDAVTNSSRISHWFLPISGELELGGHYQLEDNAGGVITACERPSHFAITWEYGGEYSCVEVQIAADGTDCARLMLRHIQYDSDFWSKYGPGASGVGWELGLMSLEMHITQPFAPMLDGAALVASSDGKALITRSGEQWGQVAIAAGVPSDAARAAAARTIAFYTGESA